MGVVYKITFPDGEFYIGSTNEYKDRQAQHMFSPSKKIKEMIIKYDCNLKEFRSFFEIICTCENHKEVEKTIIYEHKDSDLILNKMGVPWGVKGKVGKRVNIWIPEEDHKEVMKAKKAHGEGLGKLLVKLVKEDKERKQQEFHK